MWFLTAVWCFRLRTAISVFTFTLLFYFQLLINVNVGQTGTYCSRLDAADLRVSIIMSWCAPDLYRNDSRRWLVGMATRPADVIPSIDGQVSGFIMPSGSKLNHNIIRSQHIRQQQNIAPQLINIWLTARHVTADRQTHLWQQHINPALQQLAWMPIHTNN